MMLHNTESVMNVLLCLSRSNLNLILPLKANSYLNDIAKTFLTTY